MVRRAKEEVEKTWRTGHFDFSVVTPAILEDSTRSETVKSLSLGPGGFG